MKIKVTVPVFAIAGMNHTPARPALMVWANGNLIQFFNREAAEGWLESQKASGVMEWASVVDLGTAEIELDPDLLLPPVGCVNCVWDATGEQIKALCEACITRRLAQALEDDNHKGN